MEKQNSLNVRLVYLHCSSIFSGQNAHIRRPKKIRQLLEEHRADIAILTKEFTVAAIAVVARFLLEDRIFESLTRAKLRFPELFQQWSAFQEIKGVDLYAAPDEVSKSDDEDEGGVKIDDGSQPVKPKIGVKIKGKIENVNTGAATSRATPASTPKTLPIPDLNPLDLPFKSQHNILVHIQTSLEACCFQFSSTHFPTLMQAYKWDVPESIELTQWTSKFSKFLASLSSTAINRIPGQSITAILTATNTIRHAAVHRQRVTAAEMLGMLHAAVTFAHTLNDTKRAGQIAAIKAHLKHSIHQVAQHQSLLEQHFKPLFHSIAHRRTELDELEASCIRQMVAADEQQRASVGDALERVLCTESKAVEVAAADAVEVSSAKAEGSDAEEDDTAVEAVEKSVDGAEELDEDVGDLDEEAIEVPDGGF